MPTRRTMFFMAALFMAAAALCGGGAAPAEAADVAATAFVTKIYDAYRGKDSKGILTDSEAQLRLYFEPSLVAIIVKDQKAAAKRQEVPTLDGDPFVDAQEWEIAAFDIAVSDAPPDDIKAVATVSFKNFDVPVKVVLDLVKTKSGWRIADITSQQQGRTQSLRGLFKH
jgi:hypothetical protein